jgi:hypothetical protein
LTGGVFILLAVQLLAQQSTFNALILGLLSFWIISGSIAQLREVLPVSNRLRPAPGPEMPVIPLEPMGIQIGQVMERPPRAWDERAPIADFLREAEAMRLDDRAWVPVLREGYLLGIVNRRLARKGPTYQNGISSNGPGTVPNLSQVMVPRRSLAVVQAEQDLSQAVEVVRANREYPVAVLGPGGYFVGFITRDNLRG